MTERPYTTGLYLLRCFDLGLRPSDLHDITYGDVMDLLIEKGNDNETYQELASQEDMNRF